ncbi:MAG TPA: hypothetical protein VHW74_08900 [Mycobacteriales bacterium]|nr:hypothetical protein [Mycobacteriales bacterium]
MSGRPLGHPLHPGLTLVSGGSLIASVPTMLAGASDWLDTEGAESRVGTVHAATTCSRSWRTHVRGPTGVRRSELLAPELLADMGVTILKSGHLLLVSTISDISTDLCEGRQRYATYTEADRQAWYAMARRRNADEDFMLAAHYCVRCGAWHIGNPRKQSMERWSAALS